MRNAGFANPYAYRPHVGHMVFLHRQLQRLGYRTHFLTCGGALSSCASRVSLTGARQQLECLKCRAGGIHSYLTVPATSMDASVHEDLNVELGFELAHSTVCTALQIENPVDDQMSEFTAMQSALAVPVATVYANTRRWIRDNKLDVVCIFNGRMDLTRAILEACKAESVNFFTVERSWFGEGLQLLPNEGCLELGSFHKITREWRTNELTLWQALRASALMRGRLERTSSGEWRQYNLGNTEEYAEKPIRFLFLPSSQHEWLGTPDRSNSWTHPTAGVEHLLHALHVPSTELVVRGHPGWAMKIKHYGENRANAFYRAWCKRIGATYVEPSQPIDTHSMILRADNIVLNGSSAGMEAAFRGKPVIATTPDKSTASGISVDAFSAADVAQLEMDSEGRVVHTGTEFDPVAQSCCALRYIYAANYRVMQFTDQVRSTDPYTFDYADPEDLSGLKSVCTGGPLLPDDDQYQATTSTAPGEEDVARAAVQLEAEVEGSFARQTQHLRPMQRKLTHRWLDLLGRG